MDVCLTIPVRRYRFCGAKLLPYENDNNTTVKSPIGDQFIFFSFLMKIAIESPEKLSDKDLDDNIDIWNRKTRRIVCKTVTVVVPLNF